MSEVIGFNEYKAGRFSGDNVDECIGRILDLLELDIKHLSETLQMSQYMRLRLIEKNLRNEIVRRLSNGL